MNKDNSDKWIMLGALAMIVFLAISNLIQDIRINKLEEIVLEQELMSNER